LFAIEFPHFRYLLYIIQRDPLLLLKIKLMNALKKIWTVCCKDETANNFWINLVALLMRCKKSFVLNSTSQINTNNLNYVYIQCGQAGLVVNTVNYIVCSTNESRQLDGQKITHSLNFWTDDHKLLFLTVTCPFTYYYLPTADRHYGKTIINVSYNSWFFLN